MIVVVVLAAVVGPKGPAAARPSAARGATHGPTGPSCGCSPCLSLSPPAAETFIILVFPVMLIGALLLVPFVSNRGERAPSRRPVAVLSVIVIFAVLGGVDLPGRDRAVVAGDDGLERRSRSRRHRPSTHAAATSGSRRAPEQECRNCHALEGVGGRRGPDLTRVGVRLTRDQLIDQISNGTPGGGNMPAYGKQIKPAEMTALVDFLVSLRRAGPGRPAGRDQPAVTNRPYHESHARRLPALLAVRSLADPRRSCCTPRSTCAAGWLLRRRDPRRWHVGQPAAFLGGLAALFLALASPIEPFAALLLQVHMVQHLLLMMVAPPLLWLGAPLFPVAPRPAAHRSASTGSAPLCRWRAAAPDIRRC